MIDMTIPGQTSWGELDLLQTIARRVPPNGIVVELGALFGRSSFTWGTTVNPTATVYCIDPWERDGWIIEQVERQLENCPPFSHKQFLEYTRGIPNIKPIIGRSPDDVKNWDEKIDVYFDDSMHHNPYFRKNLYFWLRHMKPGGIMCGHDYCAQWPDVGSEVDKLAEILGVKVNVCEWIWWIEVPARISFLTRIKRCL